ncbi:hypothetical protein [Tistrella mobilis]|uniref:C4-dicarboxylate ABC transporter substrate-binding protein n=1 Tax=Tistrella mobilis (strain KA081020-065) TaxID=1110502 RepID=I3TU23_TISMK|nr:hypothetical protein [Tistrella mobilis]AFK56261.1 hypothetical protein TMO_b0253 [Tistrella mobilis KA081020-065]
MTRLTTLRRGLAAAAICLAATAGTAAEAATLTYGSPVPEQALFNREGVVPFLKGIETVTEGRVTFRGLFGGTVVKMPTVLSSIRDGVVNAGFVVLAFYPSDLPHASVMSELTGFGVDPVAAMGAINEAFFQGCPDCLDEMRREGQIPLFLNATAPMAMQCTSPVAGKADLQGRRVSVIGSPEARWAEALGMIPVTTSITDLLISLQTAKTDCALVPLSWAQSYGLTDVVRGVIDMPQGIVGGAVPVSVSLDAWCRIGEADRKAILAHAAASALPYVQKAYIDADAMVRPKLEAVATFSGGDAAMQAAWPAYQAGEIKALAARAAARGIAEPDAFAERIAGIYRKWHEDYLPKIKADPAEMTRLLTETVFPESLAACPG